MEEKNMKSLWHLCSLLQSFCEAHSDCKFCPFYDYWADCMVKSSTGTSPDDLWQLFPEHITSDEGGD